MQPGVRKGAEKYILALEQAHIVGYPLLPPPTKNVENNPTIYKELVTGWPHYIGVKDASSHGIGGIITGKGKACIPTVFCFACPNGVKELFCKGNIKIRIWKWQYY